MPAKRRILYVHTSRIDQPERAYAPFILATSAAMMDIEATAYFVIKGIARVKEGEAGKIRLGSFPFLKDVMNQTVKARAKRVVCEQSCNLLGIPRGDFMQEAKIVGAATLNDLALSPDAVLSF